jgi:ABC-type glycerol-3-phosphate transport system substrate-binding protein
MKKRILSAILAALLLLSATACSTAGNSSDPGEGTQTQGSETDTAFFPDVEKADYEGATFLMTGEYSGESWWFAEEYLTSGSVGVLNNTLYETNTMVEQHLNVTLAYEQGGDLYNRLSPVLLSGDDIYQLAICHTGFYTAKFVTSRFALDLYELEDLDLDQFYWDREIIDELSIKNHAYIGFGDLSCPYFYVLYCNKDMLADVGVDVPYNEVRNGTWTLDKFISMTTGLYQDDGDGQRNNKDIYGFSAAWAGIHSGFFHGCDLVVLSKNTDNEFELSFYNERFVDMFDTLYDWTTDESVWVWDAVASDSSIVHFGNGQSYFTGHSLGTSYLSSELDVGILPMPKYDAAQENYCHVNEGTPLIVPYTVRNKEMVGQVMELMAYYAGTTVLEKYYDEVLQLRVSDAPDDREMVELVFNTSVFDPGIPFSDESPALWNLAHAMYHCVAGKNRNISSFYQSNYKAVNKWLKTMMKKMPD